MKGEQSVKKQKKIAILLLSVALVLFLLYFLVLSPLFEKISQSATKEPLELLEGEGYYTNGSTVFVDQGVIYPTLSYADMFNVVVHNTDGKEYLFWHHVGTNENYFYMGEYEGASYDEGGSPTFYNPAITQSFAGFDFTTLYDGKSKIPAMLTAVGNVLFNERVYVMPEGTSPEELEQVLGRYGLSRADNAPWIEVVPFAKDDNGNFICYIGTDANTAVLYYFNPIDKKYYHQDGVSVNENAQGYVFDAAFVYTGDLALLSLVPDQENAKRLYVGRDLPSGDGYYVRLEGRNVVYMVGSVKSELANIDLANLVQKDLSYYIEPNLMVLPNTLYDPLYTPGLGMYTGHTKQDGEAIAVGDVVYLVGVDGAWMSHTVTNNPTDVISQSLLTRKVGQSGAVVPNLYLAAALSPDQKVRYTVTKLYAVCNAPYTEWTDDLVEENALIQVRVKTEDGIERDAVLSLSGEELTYEQKQLFIGAPMGECQITFEMTYTPTLNVKIQQVRRGILPVLDQIAEGDTVIFRYWEKEEKDAIEGSVTLNLSSTDSFTAALSRYLLGRTVADLPETVSFAKDACFYGTTEMSVSYAVWYEEDLSYAFYHYGTGEKDKFLADRFYQIIGPEELTAYSIDTDVAQLVLQVFLELKGTETVEVGLTPAVLEKYGLFDRQIKFALTYGTKTSEDEAGNILSMSSEFRMDYTFFVSQPQNGYRYVATDLYDAVVKVKAEVLEFLDWDFLTRYARSNLLLMYTSDIRQLEIITSFSDMQKHHSFWLSIDPAYKYQSKNEVSYIERLYVMYVEGTPETETTIGSPAAVSKPGVLVEHISDTDSRITELKGGLNLDEIYYNNGYTERDREDFMGVHYFRRMMTSVYSIRYVGKASDDLTEAEMNALMENPDAKVTEMRITLADGRVFVYSFYAYSGQRMLVSLTAYSAGGQVTDQSALFYVNASEGRKMASFCEKLAAGQPLHEDEGY